MNKKLNTRQWQIYNFLKENCVGKENKMQGADICKALGIDVVSIKSDIKKIRNCDTITRRIGSSPSGYWLMLENENGLDYIKRLTVTHLITAVKQGIPSEYFHQVLNNLPNNDLVDKQQRMTFTPYENSEVRTYSDDLVGGKGDY